MFLPLSDEAPLPPRFRPWLTWSIIGLCAIIFLIFQSGALLQLEPEVSLGFGLVPAAFFGEATIDPSIVAVAPALSPLTSLFLHGSWMHLIGNMLFLGIFGDNIERALGRTGYAALYLICGAAAGLAYALVDPSSTRPLIGASGAVSAVLGAYLVLHPNVRVYGLVFNILPVRIPAYWFILGWFGIQFAQMLMGANQNIAWLAHVAGIVLGALTMAAVYHGLLLRRARY